jgi:hypothetical protein
MPIHGVWLLEFSLKKETKMKKKKSYQERNNESIWEVEALVS